MRAVREAPEVVLDASALLAFLHGEPGADSVRSMLGRGIISAVNWSEVVKRGLAFGTDLAGLARDAHAAGLRIVPFDEEDAVRAAELGVETSVHGLSLADCACLALADRSGVPAVTADQTWKRLSVGIDVTLIR